MWMQHPLLPERAGRVCLTGYNGQLLTQQEQHVQRKDLVRALGTNLFQTCLHGQDLEE